MTYKEQLHDPRWQRLQSVIRERDKYKCQLCGSEDNFLHVHHLYYQPGAKVWEYDHESLVTLCEDCHHSAHSTLPKIITLMSMMLIKDGTCLFDIEAALRKMLNLPQTEKIPF